MRNTKYNGLEKRQHIRMTYPVTKRPIFRVGGEKFEVKDVSRSGLKFYCDKIKLKGWVKGTMDLIDGARIEVEGIVVRIENKDMGLCFIGDLKDDVYRQLTVN
jgi:hypothetical protein